MEKIKITADSICDLNNEILTKHDFNILPMYIHLGDSEERDHAGIDEKIYEYDINYLKLFGSGTISFKIADVASDE